MPPFMLTVGHNIVLNNNALIKHPAVIVLTESERNEISEMESFGKFVGKNFTTAREEGECHRITRRKNSLLDPFFIWTLIYSTHLRSICYMLGIVKSIGCMEISEKESPS